MVSETMLCKFTICHYVRADILLNGKTAIQLKFFDHAFFFNANIYSFSYTVQWQNQTSNQWSAEKVLYSRLVPDQSQFVAQSEHGLAYNAAEMVTFQLNTTSPETTVST